MADFYRICKTCPPTLDDFKSPQELGKRTRPPKYSEKSWASVSMHTTREGAVKQRERWPNLGDFIAQVAIPDAVEWVQDGEEDVTHYELWALAGDLLGWVVQTTKIE